MAEFRNGRLIMQREDVLSDWWNLVRQYAEAQVDRLTRRCATEPLSHEDTIYLRGQVAAWNELLRNNEPDQVQTYPEPDEMFPVRVEMPGRDW